MSSTYSPSLRIELIGAGEQAGTWNTTTNTNLGTLIESAIAGYVAVSVTSANQALVALDGAADQARNAVIAVSTTTGANFAVYAPPQEKQYTIWNNSPYTATIYNSTVLGNTTAAGTGITVPANKITAVWSDGVNFYVQNTHLPSLTLSAPLAVADGGTGATTSANARTNLGLGTMSTQNATSVAITGGSITGITDLAIADGGTGASTAADARTNLGLGTMATQSAASVAITGGSITGITDLAVADGGTGASTAADARTNLGLGTIATQNASAVAITGGSITGITDLAVADGGTGASTAADARTNLGLGTIATQSASNVAITGGSITGITDLAVADGGTGASDAATARTNLGLGSMAVQNSGSVSITGGNITNASITGGAVENAVIKLVPSAAPISSGVLAWNSTAVVVGTGAGTDTLASTAYVTSAISSKADKTTTISAGTGLSGGGDLSTNRTFSIANTAVAAGSYGSASAIPVLAINAQGQVTSASTAAITLAEIGVGQTYQNVTASRSFGSSYTNSTNKPIFVTVSFDSAFGIVTFYVAGQLVGDAGEVGSSGSIEVFQFIVPPGATYSTSVSGSAPLRYWTELR